MRSLCIMLDESIANLATDLVDRRADRRTEPGEQVLRAAGHCRDSGFNDASGKSAPSCVRRGDGRGGAIAQQDRQAVCGEHRAQRFARTGEYRICPGVAFNLSGFNSARSVYLTWPSR